MATRDSMLSRLGGTYDLLIIGGGITGAGAARDAARRGLKVCLVEQDDLAYGTSSRSSKLVHGGLRYLEQYEFSLVFEAVTERRVLMDIAPHLVNPLGFLFPVFKSSRRGVFTVNLGMWVYDGLSLFRSPKIHRNLSKKAVRKEEPALRQEELTGAPLYYDCSTDDARLTLESALDGAAAGATVLTHTRVVGLLRSAEGHVDGARVRDMISGEEREIRANAVINATGPWSDRTRALGKGAKPRLRPTKGIHLVVEGTRLPVNNAVVCFHPTDGRVLFAIPWGDRTYVGTTDTDFQDDPGKVHASSEDVDYLLDAANHYFPAVNLERKDVLSTWAGVRPLISEEGAGNESNVSREHAIEVDEDLLVTIAGGKLTTYRRMAAEVVDKALGVLMMRGVAPTDLRAARTDKEPLPGAVGWPEDDDHGKVVARVKEAGKGKVADDTAALLANTYGTRGVDVAELAAGDQRLAARLVDGRPEILAQIDFAVQHELAATVRDALVRRTQLFFRDHDQGLGCAEVVAERMGELLAWDADRQAKEVLDYQREVALSRRWREDAS
jgi:glycerol-3-phosphate dehydrogenase